MIVWRRRGTQPKGFSTIPLILTEAFRNRLSKKVRVLPEEQRAAKSEGASCSSLRLPAFGVGSKGLAWLLEQSQARVHSLVKTNPLEEVPGRHLRWGTVYPEVRWLGGCHSQA